MRLGVFLTLLVVVSRGANETNSPKERLQTLAVPERLRRAVRPTQSASNFANGVRRAIAVYFPGEEKKYRREISGLAASWNYVAADAVPIDLCIFLPKSLTKMVQQTLAAALPRPCIESAGNRSSDYRPKCILVPVEMDAKKGGAQSYAFAYSITFVLTPEAEFLADYDWVLRTDLDTFVTPLFASWIPRSFAVGTHLGYGKTQEQQEKLHAVSRALGLRHRGMTHLGASWYAKPGDLKVAAQLTTEVLEYLLEHVFDGKRKWHGSPKVLKRASRILLSLTKLMP